MRLMEEVTRTTTLTGTAQDILTVDVKNADVLSVDVENIGAAAFTSFSVHERVSPNAPLRDVTPSVITAESSFVFTAAANNPSTLGTGAFARFSLNVTDAAQIVLRAAGNTAVASVSAATYEVQA